MTLTCTYCGMENTPPGFCQRCGQRLPQVCPQCGTSNKPNVQYCGGCSYPFAPPAPGQGGTVQQQPGAFIPGTAAAQQQQPFPPYYPQPAPVPMQRKRGKVWVILGGVVGVLVLVLVVLGMLAPDPVDDTSTGSTAQRDSTGTGQQGQDQTNPPPQNNPQPQQPAQSKNAGLEVEPGKYASAKVVAQGDFQRTFTLMDARAGFVATGSDNSAQLYQVGNDGSMQLIKEITPDGMGKLVQVHVGDMLNTGAPGLVAVFEKALYFVDAKGNLTGYKASVKDAIVADVDGDGKQETLLQQDAGDGTNTITVVRFNGQQAEQVAVVKGQPSQTFDNASLTLKKRALLFNAQGIENGVQGKR